MPVRVPAEWTEQEWLWIGFPHAADLWLEDLVPAQEQMAAFANAGTRATELNVAEGAEDRCLTQGPSPYSRLS